MSEINMNEPTKEDLILKANYQRKIKDKQNPTKQEREANNKYYRWYRQSNEERHAASLGHSTVWKFYNPEKDKITKKVWLKKNKEKAREAYRKWLKKNPDYMRDYMRVYYQKKKLEKATAKQAEA